MESPKFKELTSEQEKSLECNITWFFCMPQTTEIAKLVPYNMEIMFEPLIGQHLGIVTDRRTEGISTNKDIHGKRKDYFFSENYKKMWKTTLRKMILNRIHAQFQNLVLQKAIIEHPTSNFGADVLENCLPNSRIIVLILDGRMFIDFQVSSFLKTNPTSKKGINLDTKKNSFIEQQAKRWLKMIQILKLLQKTHSKELFLMVRCEDLIKNPLNTLKNIYQFLDVKINEKDLINISHKIQNNEKLIDNSWQTNFSEDEKDLMNDIIGKTLGELGYQV